MKFSMEENDFFRKALADFTCEAASGGAIRHLADRGYTVKQIKEKLDFPTSCHRVQKAVWQHFIDTGVILQEKPGGSRKKKAVYVREYDKYGKATFRRITDTSDFPEDIARHREWKERHISGGEGTAPEKLAELLYSGIQENGEEFSYMSCEFGLMAYRSPSEYHMLLEALEERQKEYITGLPWERKKVYHRLDPRMREILVRLYGTGHYHGECYFVKTGERMDF